jgi:hypothetical protein
MAEQEIRPVDVQIARPVQAPNYVGMYSEAIKGALAPYEYLLNYQKELSEEDLRKAQIQNFLSEHDLKNRELSETIRSHTANEAMTQLERQLNERKETEAERHNLVDEAHQTRADEREAAREAEYERANKFNEGMEEKKLNLQSGVDDAQIATAHATADWHTSEANKVKLENENVSNDQQVIQDFNNWYAKQKPEDIYNSSENPEIQEKIDEFAGRIKTAEGRRQFDALHGEGTALGREIAERKELNAMSTDGKDVFQSTLLQSDKSKPSQLRFEEALEAARPVNAQATERAKWAQPGVDAYNKTFAATKDRQQAFIAGRTANDLYEKTLKEKAVPQKPSEKAMEFYQKMIPKISGESEEHYTTRSAQKAAEIEGIEDPVERQKAIQDLNKPAGTETKTPESYIGRKAPGTSMISPAQQQQQLPGNQPAIFPLDQQKTGLPLVQSTSPLLPASLDTNDLQRQFQDYFGTEEETTPTGTIA